LQQGDQVLSGEHGLDWQVFDRTGQRKYVSAAERGRFLAAADLRDAPTRAFCHLLAYTGCRLSEALAAQRHHLDAERGTLVLATLKRRKAFFRMVYLPPQLVGQLLALPAPGGVFWRWHNVTAWRRVKAVMQLARISGAQACPKGLRHGFGMRAAERNVPASLIQRFLGHASLRTTSVYLDAVGAEERQFAARIW
jgi:integrase